MRMHCCNFIHFRDAINFEPMEGYVKIFNSVILIWIHIALVFRIATRIIILSIWINSIFLHSSPNIDSLCTVQYAYENCMKHKIIVDQIGKIIKWWSVLEIQSEWINRWNGFNSKCANGGFNFYNAKTSLSIFFLIFYHSCFFLIRIKTKNLWNIFTENFLQLSELNRLQKKILIGGDFVNILKIFAKTCCLYTLHLCKMSTQITASQQFNPQEIQSELMIYTSTNLFPLMW